MNFGANWKGHNLPGSDFYLKGLISTLSMNWGANVPDYTGKVNLAIYHRWQKLSKTAETTGKILNLI